MTDGIVKTLAERHKPLNDILGYIIVSEKEWNDYFSQFGNKHMAYHSVLGGNSLTFKGCQLRVL